MSAVQTGTLWRVASTQMPTKWGIFDAIGFERDASKGTRGVETALALVMGDLTEGVPLLRIHSQCFTGEVLGSLRCDCHDQLEMAMQAIAKEGRGLVIYEYQEGRGIGLMAKLRAYELQDAGLDTVEANHALGFKCDCRDFRLPAAILRDLGVERVRLLSNNPRKATALAESGIEVVAQLACEVAPNPHSFAYLRAKKERMGHALSFWQCQSMDRTKHSPIQRSCRQKEHRPQVNSAAPTVAITSHAASARRRGLHGGERNEK
jgi:GTP cyclohydrolase II